MQLEEQERQVAQLRERITLLEGGSNTQRSGRGGNTVDDFSIKVSRIVDLGSPAIISCTHLTYLRILLHNSRN